MNAQILKLLFKKYWNNEILTQYEVSVFAEYVRNMDEQELNYFNKLATIYF